MKKHHVLLLAVISLIPCTVKPQYYGDRPLEMSFERADFFFSPSSVSPLGSGYFMQAATLVSEHPLAGIQRNPANLSGFDRDSLPPNYVYLDFGSSHSTGQERGHYYMPGGRMPGYWHYQAPRRPELTPLMSAAWFNRLPVLNRSVTLGLTYQLISQGENYYAIPHDIYKNVAGRSYDGMAYAGTESYSIIDRFSGSDEMYHEGHAISALLSWEISEALTLGLKAGRFIFERDGSQGSNNLWNQQLNYQSYWKMNETRAQEYGHWDFSAGLIFAAGSHRLGLHAGLLTGTVDQVMARDDESISKYGDRGSSNFSDYSGWYKSDQAWEHSGQNLYAGFLWERHVREGLDFRFMYNFSRITNDLGLRSSIENESENEYYYVWSNGFNESEGFSKMHDFRNGSGERTLINNRFGVAMTWQLGGRQTLTLGGMAGFRNHTTNTSEMVDGYSESSHKYRYEQQNYSSNYEYYHKTIEDKTINWEYTSRLRTIQIPLLYELAMGERFGLLLGVSRSMSFLKTENSSLILYDYRERTQNDETLIERMTGERITEPRERLSVVQTNMIGGLTFSPAEMFSIRLIVSPGVEKNSVYKEYEGSVHVMLGMQLRL